MSDNNANDRDIDALPLDWQEEARERGIRHVISELEETPATQADIARAKRDHERLAERHDAEIRVLSKELGLTGVEIGDGRVSIQQPRLKAQSDQIRDLHREMRRIERETPSTTPAVALSIIAVLLSLTALAIAYFS